MKPGGPRAIGDLIGGVIGQSGLGRGSGKLDLLQKAWREAVGRATAEATRLKAFKSGTLTVEVDSAALAQELGVYYKRQLIARLKERSKLPVQDLRFRVVGNLEAGKESPPKGRPDLA